MLASICIQHHPSRLLPEALRRYEVVEDPDPEGPASAIRTYIECLRSIPPGVSHRIVLQDDVVLCSNFASRAHHALHDRPEHLVAFFVPNLGLHGRWVREAAKAGKNWCQLPGSVNWVPVVALSWPRGLAEQFVPFAEEFIRDRASRRMHTVVDDPVVGKFARLHRLTVWATVPSLVEHPDIGFSLVKKRNYDGQNPSRKAALFAGD